MPGKREQAIIEAYESWDSDESTVGELVEQLGISRQRLYDVLDRNQIVPKSRRKKSNVGIGSIEADLLGEMAEMALGYLLGQLQEAREELRRYREHHGPLD